jgi:hypothetical protein
MARIPRLPNAAPREESPGTRPRPRSPILPPLVNRLRRLSLQEPHQSAISHADSLPSTVPDTNRNHCELVGMALKCKPSAAMSKLFVNENPQGPPPLATVAPQPRGDTAHVVANVRMILFGLAIAGGVALLLYHYWKVVLAFLLAMVLFACWSSRVAAVAIIGVLLVVLTVLGQSGKAQTVVDGDTTKLNGMTYRIWGIDAAETRQACADGWMAGQEASKAMPELVSDRKISARNG